MPAEGEGGGLPPETTLAFRGPRFGIIGPAFGADTGSQSGSATLDASASLIANVVSNASSTLDGISSIVANPILQFATVTILDASASLIATGSSGNDVFAVATLTAIAYLVAAGEVPCPCPEWSVDATLLNTFKTDQTLDNTFTQKAEVSTNPWRKKNCE